MKVYELMDILREMNAFDDVYLASDEEVNNIGKLYGIEECFITEDNDVVKLREITPVLEEMGYTEDDVGDETTDIKAVLLIP